MKLTAKSIQSVNFTSFKHDAITIDVLKELSSKRLRGCIVLDKDGSLVGYMPERKFIFSTEAVYDFFEKPIGIFEDDFIEIPTVSEDSEINEILKKLSDSTIDRIAVTDDSRKVVGVITPKDIVVELIKDRGRDKSNLIDDLRLLHKSLNQHKLVEEHQRYKEIVENSPNMIHSVDKDGNIIEVNDTECRILGYEREDFLKLKVGDVYAPELIKEMLSGFEKLKSEQETFEVESVIITKTGERIPVEVSSVPVNDVDGNFVYTRTILTDISERFKNEILVQDYIKDLKDTKKTLETEIDEITKVKKELETANLKLEEVNKLKDELLTMVSHDLKNPLGTIIGLSKILVEDKDSLDGEDVYDFAKRISNQGKNALQLCENLLQSHKLDGGSLKLFLEDVKINDLVKKVINDFEFMGSQKNVKFNFENNGELVNVLCDRERVMQVFSNLASNALKFAPEGSEVTISLKVEDKRLLISVTDSGPGVSADDVKDLFDKEKQLERRNLTGTGFGLSIVRRIVALHGGEVKVESEPNVETKFTFILPNVLKVGEAINCLKT